MSENGEPRASDFPRGRRPTGFPPLRNALYSGPLAGVGLLTEWAGGTLQLEDVGA